MFYSKIIKVFIVLFFALNFTACDMAGSAYPTKYGAEYLEKKNYSKDLIESVISIAELEESVFEALSKEGSTDVRFLIAKNPYISLALLSRMASDSSSFVRGGAALNPNLTVELIEKLSADSSHTTRLYIARNSSVPEKYLLELHNEHNMELIWFAYNPNCPEILKQKMADLNDLDALHVLEVEEKRRAYLMAHPDKLL